MKLFSAVSAFLLLTGCPTPPETVTNNAAPDGQPAQGQPNNPPPADGAGGDAAKAGKGGKAGKLGKSGGDAGGDAVADGGEGGGAAEPPPTGNPSGTLPSDSMIIEIQRAVEGDETPSKTQADLTGGDHITFAGTIETTTYSGALIMRVSYPPGSDDVEEAGLITALTVAEPGDFSLALPSGEELLVLEILADANSDGLPTVGERAAIYMLTGDLAPSESRSDMELKLAL